MDTQISYRILPVALADLGEGPVWDEQRNRLLWVDIVSGRVNQWYADTEEYEAVDFPCKVGSIALMQTNKLVAATDKGFAFLNLENGEFAYLVDPEEGKKGNRFNDGKCDSQGRFWAGSLNEKGQKQAAALYLLDGKGVVTKKIDKVSCSNGMAWSPNDETFYFIDTSIRQIVAYDFESGAGRISNRRIVIEVDPADGLPDGMTIDAEGMLWIALWGGWKVVRWDPGTGEKLAEIRLPVSQVTSCAFGGADLNDLYITSAKIGLTAEERRAQPAAGSLFVVKNLSVSGMATNRYVMQDGSV